MQHEARSRAAAASSVPVDDSQPDCALSGERFTTFWHEPSESWHYQDAVRLHGEEASRQVPSSDSLCILSPCMSLGLSLHDCCMLCSDTSHCAPTFA